MRDFEDSSRVVFQTLSVSFPRVMASLSGKPGSKRLGISKGVEKKDGKHHDSTVGSMGMRPHVTWITNND